MLYAVYADLPRPLTKLEQSAVFEALEANVPDSGCVGRDTRPNDEVYFCVEALSEEEATAQARHYMDIVLQRAELEVEYAISLQTFPAV
jgi:hypothetical protein